MANQNNFTENNVIERNIPDRVLSQDEKNIISNTIREQLETFQNSDDDAEYKQAADNFIEAIKNYPASNFHKGSDHTYVYFDIQIGRNVISLELPSGPFEDIQEKIHQNGLLREEPFVSIYSYLDQWDESD